MLLFETPHGSHLYGLAHAGSDRDVFRVVEKRSNIRAHYAKQTISGVNDVMVMDLPTFLSYAARGVPQVLEAMYSQQATLDLIPELREGFYPDLRLTFRTYRRTTKHFLLDGREKDQPKRVRHAYRIALNFETLAETGRFNPTMTPEAIERMDYLVATEADPGEICEDAYSALI
jgi:predicted nucleotidyltransferase